MHQHELTTQVSHCNLQNLVRAELLHSSLALFLCLDQKWTTCRTAKIGPCKTACLHRGWTGLREHLNLRSDTVDVQFHELPACATNCLGSCMRQSNHRDLSCLQTSPCEGVPDGFYIHHGSDCKVYTYCHQGLADVFRCLKDTIFSEAENICVSESTVQCAPEYRQAVPAPHGALQQPLDSAEQIQNDLAALKEKLERARALRAQQETQRKRQIKFRELRDLLDSLKTTLEEANGEGQGQQPRK